MQDDATDGAQLQLGQPDIPEMIRRIKAVGYSVIRTERLGTLYAQFVVDRFELEMHKDFAGYLEHAKRSAVLQIANRIADGLFETLQFKRLPDEDNRIDTYLADITVVRPAS